LERVATTLLEREVLDAEEVRMVIEGVPLKEREPAYPERTPEKKAESKGEKKAESKGEKKASLTTPILPEPKTIPQS